MRVIYDLDLEPSSADDQTVVAGLQASNAQLTGHKTFHYSVFARDEKGKVLGGALVYVGQDSAFVDGIWVEKSHRLRGIGRQLLNEVEKEAQRRGCVLVKLDTYEFQAPKFYLACGYEVYGEVKNFTRDCSKVFLRKGLTALE
jgi:GNAT superfamily N-acetyltransferase